MDTVWALVAVFAMWGFYFLGTRPGNNWGLTAGIIVVGTILPAWVVFKLLGQGWAELGFTRRRLIVSLVVAAILGAGSLRGLTSAAQAANSDVLPHLVANIAVFWEPFFVFGFLFLRWEKAFGYLIAPVLVGIGFFIQHIGAVPLPVAASFGAFGLFFGIVFAFTRNLFILWPLFYGVASGIGTIQSGYAFGWGAATQGIVTMVVQGAILAGLWWWWRGRRTANPVEDRRATKTQQPV